MSVFGDVVQALRKVILIDAKLEQLQKDLQAVNADVEGLMNVVGDLRDRVSRIEGFIEGRATMHRPQAQLPSE